MAIQHALRWGLQSDISQPIIVGKGCYLPLRGWCYHPDLPIDRIGVLLDQTEYGAEYGEPRIEFAETVEGFDASSANSLTSGFRVDIPLYPIPSPQTVPIALRVYLASEIVDIEVGSVDLFPVHSDQSLIALTTREADSSQPLVAICLPTFNPPLEYFKQQINTILSQSYQNWICIINDDHSDDELYQQIQHIAARDDRFVVCRNEKRLGVYRNVERCLTLVPSEAKFVALSDQDDTWNSDKLETLAAVLEKNADVWLVYSDMEITSRDGKVLASTFWTTRGNNYKDLSALLLVNTITGAASMFRTELIPYLLPFPSASGDVYHDHWIGCTAATIGSIDYIDRPLYQYRQHGSNVIGHSTPASVHLLPNLTRILKWSLRPLSAITRPDSLIWMLYKEREYLTGRTLLAKTLLLRADNLSAQKQALLRKFIKSDQSLLTLILQGVSHTLRRHPTLGIEWRSLHSKLVSRLIHSYAKKRKELLFQSISLHNSVEASVVASQSTKGTRSMGLASLRQNKLVRALRQVYQTVRYAIFRPGTPADRFYLRMRDLLLGSALRVLGRVQGSSASITTSSYDPTLMRGLGILHFIQDKIAPLKLEVNSEAVPCRNLIMGAIEFKHFFGGYLSMFNFCLAVAKSGYKVRIILVDTSEYDIPGWRTKITDYEGLAGFFDQVEVIYRHDRSLPVEVSPNDRFIATSWWTAHIAHQAAKALHQDKFVYLSQEFEPMFYAGSSFYALAQQSYSLPHYALFSTELLRQFFRENRMGIFANGDAHGEQNSISFENAIRQVKLDADEMRNRRTRKLLFYARPDEHASRNMFELGMLAILEAVQKGDFDLSRWEFYGVGSLLNAARIELIDKVSLQILPKVTLNRYYEILPQFDLGLSLMMTPHPSLVPLDMAAAGMISVTNTFANKTAEQMSRISPNILAVDPTIDDIRSGLLTGIQRIDAMDQRIAGAKLNWASTWQESFNEEVVAKVEEWLS